jgi:hypothetical protein
MKDIPAKPPSEKFATSVAQKLRCKRDRRDMDQSTSTKVLHEGKLERQNGKGKNGKGDCVNRGS